MIKGINLDLAKIIEKPLDTKKSQKITSNENVDSFKEVLTNEKTNVSKKDTKSTKEVEEKTEEDTSKEIIEELVMVVNLLNDLNVDSSNVDNNLDLLLEELNSMVIPENFDVSNLLDSKENNTFVNLFALLDNTKEAIDTNALTTIQGLLNEINLMLDKVKDNVNLNDNLNLNIETNKIEELESSLDLIRNQITEIEEMVTEILPKGSEGNKDILNFKNLLQSKLDNSTDNKAINLEGTVETQEVTLDPEASLGEEFSSKNELMDNEDEILNSIINDDEDTKVTKFTLMTNNISSRKTEAVVEPKVISKMEMAQDVVKTVKYMTTNNVKELLVRVNPKELGEIAIRIIQEDGVMKANLKASSKETYSLLSQSLGDIKKYLGEQNIKIQEVDISLYEDTTYFKEEFSGKNFNEGNRQQETRNEIVSSSSSLEEEEVEGESEILSNINMLA